MSDQTSVIFKGRILFLTEDLDLLRQQLDGQDLAWNEGLSLIDNISTDEITPGWVCFYYDETLGEYTYVGLRGKQVERNDIRSGGFEVIVSGKSKGCGSSRETAPYSEKAAGIRLVIAKNIEKIYGQNSQNIGLLTSTDFGLIPRILAGEAIPLSEFTDGQDPISVAIIEAGGLFEYSKRRMAGQVSPPAITTGPRPMTLVEKVIAQHTVVDLANDETGVSSVEPGDALFVRAGVRFSHEYVTPMGASLFRAALGKEARVSEPESVYAFRDHLTFLGEVMPENQLRMGLLDRANGLADTQVEFTEEQGIRLFGEVAEGGSEAICHNAVLDELVTPGDVVVGTDSHTCTAGAVGAFAFGVGSTDMANGWYTRDFRVKVPQSVRFNLHGEVPPDCSAKDVMLQVMATEYIREGKAIGQVLEFGGSGVTSMNLDERATLTNMAVEAGAFTGIIEVDQRAIDELAAMRGVRSEDIGGTILQADADAEYVAVFDIDLTALRPMVATPGDPRNGIEIERIDEKIEVDIAYGGSCTGGKRTDMDLYAQVLGQAVAQGRQVAENVDLYIQFGSQDIRRYAEDRGYIDLFRKAGARLVNPSCGACIKAGPGVSLNDSQVTISAINRNFPGRSGPGDVYLGSPLVVAASALAGYIIEPRELEGILNQAH
ncbi:MAG: 3-isopropylmalate dehydratase [Deltaproteobacteria bacterium]|nr:3-isopropylmalate dehydratase [Deltaproteobacteria bacterium]